MVLRQWLKLSLDHFALLGVFIITYKVNVFKHKIIVCTFSAFTACGVLIIIK